MYETDCPCLRVNPEQDHAGGRGGEPDFAGRSSSLRNPALISLGCDTRNKIPLQPLPQLFRFSSPNPPPGRPCPRGRTQCRPRHRRRAHGLGGPGPRIACCLLDRLRFVSDRDSELQVQSVDNLKSIAAVSPPGLCAGENTESKASTW